MSKLFFFFFFFFFFKQKTAYEMSLRDWSSDVCSSDLRAEPRAVAERDSHLDVAERGEPRLHTHRKRQHAAHRVRRPVERAKPLGEVHEPAALGVDRAARGRELAH